MAEMKDIDENLAASINDPQAFQRAFVQFETRKRNAERERMMEIQQLNEDPFNIESQRKIEELIRQEQVMQNLQNALEHHPEVAFGRVTMLYIPVHVNGVFVKAFVDSGAQATIMSPDCAQRCGIMRLMDSRFSGIARGVGTAKILGRVHSAQIKIGNLHLPCSFTVMEGKSVELLLGLDVLKRHQAKIDLMENRLVIQDESVEFLPEAEIPKDFMEELEEEPKVAGPDGTAIGGRSGAIVEIPQAAQQQQQQQQHQQQAHQGQQQGPPPPLPERSHQPPPARRSFPEDHIQTLMGLGVSREQAVQALEIYDGNVDMAANSFFQ